MPFESELTQYYYKNQFLAPINSYDFHTYYFQSYQPSRLQASELREKLLLDFAQEIADGQINVFKLWDAPVGPHPYAMWEADVRNPEVYGRLVQWYALNHGDLSVLIHPHTGDDFHDHVNCGIWLGDKVKLIVDSFA
ncbi:dopa 4,5-dioxygenase [Nadsonia fulvescens var. elongata DSM 6958]|uniref:Dopa 4,5-dioxygenase n=1 Tax=Nadsonia fulvescens var. elongata DSM 6958 TaxID=857566 RepID=A0A1E3PR49_9ASCO|nr:dopa 4,5-dioxygenase [Nadsonia fulvescens var. elongata DSM 6958]